ncbi:MAG: aminomethyl-transferring glycine dehydrogenase subunit GcvPB [Rhodospirillaceae bacterium]|jgi:glycine dehydrogenase subunit 2|nr:aminomethyl-transferring glycine dehydrogenase subunit GcvPB [Rhodospirillaceae bacterium]MBT5079018.1 aminomethyl-transferring glycine dehydrogenase subunit GcvPB [Rhodospirillaceae bacterium]MBT6587783.1 aminomethyl-transferring glycine dehydrogenase subunit GcvPB [Rhodospirillaceae bacterium]MBT6987432.1 aminomethyl-transferring glycine dehydrogenase subunit GcvPB [Rhodospirillaceae bacterium]MBT7285708.1 aminomethyl-transferring glycine dehydrogenase subunit GcvPB [Rhodospirillaceae bact
MTDPNTIVTSSGHRGLDLAEPLIFELDSPGRCGVDLPPAPAVENRLGGLERQAPIGLPGLSEPQVVRHFVRLSRNNFAIDAGLYPLGSCTMKHNPRLNEKVARLPGFADIHPMQPMETVQGALELIDTLADWLLTLTGMPAIAMSPAAGAHGELCGLMTIRAALEARGDGGDAREVVLVPTSAHGTNPATAAICGYRIEQIPADDRGRVDLAALKEKLGPHVAAIMLTNPNTCGLFENEIVEIAEAVHAAGAYFYCDGANFNAIVGKVRPGDLGIDCMHLNLHKTFSTPHGGGGPGSGPVVLAEALAPYAPLPMVVRNADGLELVENAFESSIGRLKGFHGQMGMFVRALSFILSHGADGLRQASEDAVLNANYIMAQLQDLFSLPFPGPCMHEVLFDDSFLKDSGVTTLDFAKAMIDEGFHPMTMYFPLVVSGAMLIEPTESESKASLDQFIASMRHLGERAVSGDAEFFAGAPYLAPYRRLDETQAARKPVLRWHGGAGEAEAAE